MGLRTSAALAAFCLVAGPVTACGSDAGLSPGAIAAVGAENQYANVIAQIGGSYVRVSAIMNNPNTDPHNFEASPRVAEQVSAAELVVQNGLGYDSFMNRIEAATPSSRRAVIDVQRLLGLPGSTPNPHLWYDPSTMPSVAGAIAGALARLEPAHASYFEGNRTKFNSSLKAWNRALGALGSGFPHAPVAATEPVADYMLQAAGLDNLTPWAFQADIMNGVDPSAQDVALERSLLTRHQVRAFLYNRQVTDSLTESLQGLARSNSIPMVAVYETMPVPGYDYQSWMLAEVDAIRRALDSGVSTTHL
jgi:zinc/manganese transport system substrate-binding protein